MYDGISTLLSLLSHTLTNLSELTLLQSSSCSLTRILFWTMNCAVSRVLRIVEVHKRAGTFLLKKGTTIPFSTLTIYNGIQRYLASIFVPFNVGFHKLCQLLRIVEPVLFIFWFLYVPGK